MITIAIDPGVNGGIAWLDPWGFENCQSMPAGMTEQADLLRRLSQTPAQAVVERVGAYMPGNSGPAAATFARHCGHIDAILYCHNIAIVANPTPQTWMKGLGTWPKDKQERKRAIKEAMARRFPHLDVTLKTADALGMLAWWMDKQKHA